MSKFIRIWNAKPPRTYKRFLFRYGSGIKWRYIKNWKFNFYFPNFFILTPFFRLAKFNGVIEVGLGNHYFEIGY